MEHVESVQSVRWDGDVPKVTRPIIEIWGARQNHVVQGLCLSPRPLIVWVHFIDSRTRPCMRTPLTCIACREQAARQKGYLGCFYGPTGRLFMAELTEKAMQDCPEIMDGQTNLSGRRIKLSRLSSSKNSRVTVSFSEQIHKCPVNLTVDLKAELGRIWFGRDHL